MKTKTIFRYLITLIGAVLVLFNFPVFAQVFPKNKSEKLKILVVSDLNGAYGTTAYSTEVLKVMDKLGSFKPDLILSAGDMIAGQKRGLTNENLEAMWDSFDRNIFQKISASGIPFGFTVGNHDASPSFQTERELAYKFWNQRKTKLGLNFVDDTHFPLYYSFLQNGKFIISWDAASAKVPEAVYEWMAQQLNSTEAKSASHKIIIGHLPLYAIVQAKNKPGEVNDSPEHALNFFKDHGVDIYISGHQHAYYPAKKESVLLFNAGAIGDGPRAILGHDKLPQKAFTILTLRKKKVYKFFTLNPTSNKSIKLKDLPNQVEGFNGLVEKYNAKQ